MRIRVARRVRRPRRRQAEDHGACLAHSRTPPVSALPESQFGDMLHVEFRGTPGRGFAHSMPSSEPLRRRGRGLSSLTTAAIVAFAPLPLVEPVWAAETDPFSIVLIPDTQNYTYGNRTAYLNQQMDWIVASKDQLNTKFVAHLGDLVSEYDNTSQWSIVSAAMKRVDDAGIPNSVIPGNHDFNNATRAFPEYNSHFPVSRYSQAAWNSSSARYAGYLGENQFGPDEVDRQNMNSYTLVSAGGRDLLILNLEFEAPTYALNWADRVLAAHPDRIAIMVTHSFLALDGSRRTTPQSAGGTAPSRMWSDFVETHCQVRMVLSGHEHNGDLGEARRTDNNVCGEPVHQILSDFQDRANGGDGWLRYLTFDPVAGTVTAKTYSTALRQFETDASSQFTLPFPLTSNPPANIAPIAEVSLLSTSDRTVHLSAATSNDVDGTISSYAWDFGDGTTGAGVTPTHTYVADDTYDVVLTVTDDDAETGTATKSITVSTAPSPTANYIAADAFERAVLGGWGTADTGGPWTIPPGSADLSVSDGAGVVTLRPNETREPRLGASMGTSTVTDVQVSSDVVPTGGAASATVIGRYTSQYYGARVRFEPGGVLRMYLLRGETSLVPGGGVVAPGSYAAGQRVNVRLSVRGTNPTALAAKFWKAGTTEPSAWQLQATDSTAGLQSAGQLALRSSLSRSASIASSRLRYDNLTVSTAQAPPANAAPVARFTHTESGLRSTFDSSTSTASGDATITGYAWDFGDGASGTQASPSHRYDAAGTYTVSLVVTDSRGVESEAVSKSVTVTHADPTASFLMSTDGLGVATDASASEAADGATLSYEWSWGDGSATDSGVNAAHTYADPGTYSVRLTVTDSLGSTDTATKPANVASANPNLRAFDAFGRTVGTGWGDADTGGAWSGTAGFSVAGGVGLVSVPATVSRSTTLPVSIGDATATFTVGVDKAIADGTAQVNYVLHKSSAGDYRVKLRYLSSGQVAVWLTKKVGNSTETLLANGGTLDGFTQTDGAALNVKVNSATTGGSTTLRTKVWPVGTSEPTAWKATATDSEAALQGAGEIGLGAYANGAVSNAPLSFSFDNLNVSGEAVPDVAPVARFTHTESGLRSTFDSSTSTASGDATITGYAWDFGDGASGTQASPSHRYDAAGTYTVWLVVTDSRGVESEAVSKSVTVTHADPTASFLMSTDGLGVATDASASEAADGATLSYEWSWGDGSATDSGVNAAHTYADPGTYSVRLTVTDSLGSTDTATKPANVASANPNLRAFDAFGRTVGTGWGDADTGGAWSGTAGFSVAGGVGLVSVPATVSRSTTLPVSIGDATATFTVGVDKAIADGTAQVNYVLHKSSAGDYRVKLRYLSSGQVAVWLTKKVGNSTETLLANGGTLDGFTQTDGAALNVKVNSATTGGSTTLRTKVWPVGTSEPTAWKATATDSEAALQGAGEIGLGAYANGAVSNAPLSFSFDNLNVD